MQKIMCLVAKCSVDSNLSFQVSCNHTVGSSRHEKKKGAKSFATSYVLGETMDTIHYANQWLQYLPLKSENIATVLDNVVRKSQTDIIVILHVLSKPISIYSSRVLPKPVRGQHLQSHVCNGFWASLVQHLQ